eukprot:150188-Karenia_brevis.AAC.1
MAVCSVARRHRGRKSHDTPKYGLLFAANAGCLECVKYWIEEEGVDVNSTSDNHPDWDAESFAEWGNGENQAAVIQYLRS